MWGLILDNFSYKGLIIVALSLLPSIIMAFLPPKDAPKDIKGNIVLSIMETVGRAALIVLLLFGKGGFDTRVDAWFVLMCGFGLLYYAAWIRYFCFGRSYELLYSPLLFVPVPLAVFPTMSFAFAAIWGRNALLGLAVAILAIGHIPQSYKFYKEQNERGKL